MTLNINMFGAPLMLNALRMKTTLMNNAALIEDMLGATEHVKKVIYKIKLAVKN